MHMIFTQLDYAFGGGGRVESIPAGKLGVDGWALFPVISIRQKAFFHSSALPPPPPPSHVGTWTPHSPPPPHLHQLIHSMLTHKFKALFNYILYSCVLLLQITYFFPNCFNFFLFFCFCVGGGHLANAKIFNTQCILESPPFSPHPPPPPPYLQF